jgi:hypothetical protein
MGFLRDLGFYLKRLVSLDSIQAILFGVSLVLLVAGAFVSPSWAVVVFLVILMWSGFRLWRDERKTEEFESTILRGIADHIRAEIDEQFKTPYRSFTWAENNADRKHHEEMFRKHLPHEANAIDEWFGMPHQRENAKLAVLTAITEQLPGTLLEDMRNSVASSILTYVYSSLFHGMAPPGRFDVSDVEGYGLCLRFAESASSWGVFSNHPNVEGMEGIASDLNALSVSIWGSPEVHDWREIIKSDSSKREELRQLLTHVVFRAHFTRKYCDSVCYGSSSSGG